ILSIAQRVREDPFYHFGIAGKNRIPRTRSFLQYRDWSAMLAVAEVDALVLNGVRKLRCLVGINSLPAPPDLFHVSRLDDAGRIVIHPRPSSHGTWRQRHKTDTAASETRCQKKPNSS